MIQVNRKTNDPHQILSEVISSEGAGPHVSVYLPISGSIHRKSLHPVLNRLLGEALRLLQPSYRDGAFREHVRKMVSILSERNLKEGDRGIAFFSSPHHFYHTTLGTEPSELVVVADSFHIKPLLHCVASRPVCHAIAVNSKQVRIYRLEGRQVSLVGTYAQTGGDADRRGTDGMVGQRKRAKETTDRFFKEAVKELLKVVPLRHQWVAVLGPQVARKRFCKELEVKTPCQIILESTMHSSMEEMAKAIEPRLRQAIEERTELFVNRVVKTGDKGLMTDSLPVIAEAALHGRIDRLMVDPSVHIWGVYDRETGQVKTHAKQTSEQDDCVLDDITEQVLRMDGDVVFFDSSQAAGVPPYLATLRW